MHWPQHLLGLSALKGRLAAYLAVALVACCANRQPAVLVHVMPASLDLLTAHAARAVMPSPFPPTGGAIVGLDIGCGANLIYPLLGACLAGWRMLGADCTPAALEWAARNLGANPQLAGLIELRAVGMQPDQAAYLQAAAAGAVGAAGAAAAPTTADKGAEAAAGDGTAASLDDQATAAVAAGATPDAQAAAEAAAEAVAAEALAAAPAVASAAPAPVLRLSAGEAAGSGIISGTLRKGERIAFCMCNPPFFESLEEAGRNPATAYGGTAPEMVYPGAHGGS